MRGEVERGKDPTPLGFPGGVSILPELRTEIMHDSRAFTARVFTATLALASLTIGSACSSDSVTSPSSDDAALVFARLADSVSRSGGDSSISGAYASIADVLRAGGRVSPITITVDGTPTAFLATAQLSRIQVITSICAAGATCPTPRTFPPLRTLVAWQRDDPRRVIQLSSSSDAEPISAYLYPTFAPLPFPAAFFVYLDGKGGSYFGSSGSQAVTVKTSETACDIQGKHFPAIPPAPPKCTLADFTVRFDAKAEPSSFLTRNNTATGTHTFGMSSQAVLGAAYEIIASQPILPPIKVQPSAALPAVLTAKVDSVVTLTLTVTNPSATPVDVVFSSGQRYDFAIISATTGAEVWRWSVGRGFTMAFGQQTLAANGTLVFVDTWKPTVKGNLVAVGSLVSASHRAEGKAQLTVP